MISVISPAAAVAGSGVNIIIGQGRLYNTVMYIRRTTGNLASHDCLYFLPFFAGDAFALSSPSDFRFGAPVGEAKAFTSFSTFF